MAATASIPREAIAAFCAELRRLRIRPQRVLLFGSWAEGRPHEGSDIDLVVVSTDFRRKGFRRRLELLGIAAARALVPVQAIGYTPEEVEARYAHGFLDGILQSGPVQIPL